MSVKHILSYIEGLSSDSTTLETAYRLSHHFSATIEAFHVKLDAHDTIPFVGQGISAPVVEQIITSIESEGKDISKRSIAHVNEFLEKHPELTLLKNHKDKQSLKQILWTQKEGRATEILPEYARLSDLVIMSQASTINEEMTKLIAEEVVRESARPVLFAVQDVPPTIGESIVFYWNGSRESARILTAALPFLNQAKSVTLMTATECEEMGLGSDLVLKSLARHGIAPKVIKFKEEGERLAESILDKATTSGADLIVMGAYTHSKLRQWVMGSMTDYILQNTTLPLLVIH